MIDQEDDFFSTIREKYPRTNQQGLLRSLETKQEEIDETEYILPANIPPREGCRIVYEADLVELFPIHNPLLFYRTLKLIYGPPDILEPNQRTTDKRNSDWSYAVNLQNDHTIRVYCAGRDALIEIQVWAGTNNIKILVPSLLVVLDEFITALVDTINRHPSLFDEKRLLKDSDRIRTHSNFNQFMSNFRSAIALRDQADSVAQDAENVVEDVEEHVVEYYATVITSLQGSAAIYMAICLEAAVNMIYENLLRIEFDNDVIKRSIKNDFDLKVSNLHIYCSGFNEPPIPIGSGLWKRYRRIRRFRNACVHPHHSDSHTIYEVNEDNHTFFYHPGSQFRGNRIENKDFPEFPPPEFLGNKIEELFEDLVELISAIQSSLDGEGFEQVGHLLNIGPIIVAEEN